MKGPMRVYVVLPMALLALALAGCAGGGSSAFDSANKGTSGGSGSSGSGSGGGQSGEVRLLANAHGVVNGKEVSINGDFRDDTTRQRLQGDLEDAALAAGTQVSFCLVHGTTTTPLAVGVTGQGDEPGEIEDADEAEFGLDTQHGQTVPAVVVGDKLEGHQGAGSSGADCTTPAIISATFAADPNNNNNNNNNNNQEVRLLASAHQEVNENEATELTLNGDFRIDGTRTRLKGSFEDGNLPVGTSISFCLVSGTESTTGVGVGKLAPNDNPAEPAPEAEFSLDSQKGQTVPTVTTGDKLEAHQGANADGTANCGAPLLLSATFQPKN